MPTLTVTISSFSYKSEIPQDVSEHGGGFIFDCRCLPNPGREPGYENLTGLDPQVIKFLEDHSEVEDYRINSFSLVNQALNNYRVRGFDHLWIAFGCTGGQHRSVYFSELLANQLRSVPDVKVKLTHFGLAEKGLLPENYK